MNLATGKVDVIPDCVEQLAATHPCAKCGKDKDVPPERIADLCLSGHLYHASTFIITEDMNGPLGRLGLMNILEGIVLQLAAFNH
jgi:hypothetical protein